MNYTNEQKTRLGNHLIALIKNGILSKRKLYEGLKMHRETLELKLVNPSSFKDKDILFLCDLLDYKIN